MPRTIYLTGSDRNMFEVLELKSWHCQTRGFKVILPAEHDLPLRALTPAQHRRAIAAENLAAIGRCDLLAVNITPLEGLTIDGDTAAEIGAAYAASKPVFAYTSVLDIFDTGNNLVDLMIRRSGGSFTGFKAPREEWVKSMAAFERAIEKAKVVRLPYPRNQTPLAPAA